MTNNQAITKEKREREEVLKTIKKRGGKNIGKNIRERHERYSLPVLKMLADKLP